MTLLNKVEQPIKEWLWSIAIKKSVISLAKLIVSFAIANGISAVFSIGDIKFNLRDVVMMAAALNSLLTILRNYLKIKFPKVFGWL